MNRYNKTAHFYIPALFNLPLNLFNEFFTIYQDNPEYFATNVEISGVYGAPACIWNGGRVMNETYSLGDIKRFHDFFIEIGMNIRLTFTNCLLTKECLYDIYCNSLLKIFEDNNNEIIINSPLLEEWIRSHYGNKYRYVSSITKCIDLEGFNNELEKDYHLVMLPLDENKNKQLLNSLTHPEKVELLCNASCQDGCTKRALHYEKLSQAQLNYGCDEDTDLDCPYMNTPLYKKFEWNHFITPKDINNYYLNKGYNHFKLEGRNNMPTEWIENMVFYLIKDEYQLEVRQRLMNSLLEAN